MSHAGNIKLLKISTSTIQQHPKIIRKCLWNRKTEEVTPQQSFELAVVTGPRRPDVLLPLARTVSSGSNVQAIRRP